LKTEILSHEKNIIVIKADFDTEEIKKAVEKTIINLSKKANIKGFRKGHVPRKTIELYFGKKGICGETLEKIIPDAIDKMIEEYELKLIAEPAFKPAEIDEDKPYELEVTFEVSPEIDLPDIEAIEAEKTIYKPTDAILNENIERILDAHSEIVPTYEERELNKDDYVSVKYTSSIVEEDGSTKVVEEGQKTEINLGQENMRPEIVNAVIGKKPGETATVDFPVEENSENRELAGKKMRYQVEILGIMKKKTRELNDETVAEITQSKNKTVEEFKNAVMEQLKTSAERESTNSLKDSAVRKLCDICEVELPETLLTRQKNSLKADQAERVKRDSGMTFDEFLEKSGMDKDAYEAELDAAAKHIVKRALVLEALADDNNIEWTPEELNTEIQRIAIASRIDPKKLQDYIYEDRDRLFEIAEKIRNRKAIDFLITKVKIKETEENKPADAEDSDIKSEKEE